MDDVEDVYSFHTMQTNQRISEIDSGPNDKQQDDEYLKNIYYQQIEQMLKDEEAQNTKDFKFNQTFKQRKKEHSLDGINGTSDTLVSPGS